MKRIIVSLFLFGSLLLAQRTPLEAANYSKVTSHAELSRFIKEIADTSKLIKTEVFARSVEGKELYAVYFSKGEFGKDKSKIKVLIFCQQHGNEQSGKEGALLLTRELLKPENAYLFDKIDFALVPQMNPDGSEKNSRRNGNSMDLNRNHLIMTEPETIGLHDLFDKYLFEVTMDVHEYYPYGETWKTFGYRSNNDIEAGVTTNCNISEKIRALSKKEYLPFLKKYLNDGGISYFEYSPGGPPEKEYIRHSTFDINDGRQSLGVQNTFSFIQEGMNGLDVLLDNIEHRTKGQMRGMRALLEYTYANKDKIKNLVAGERKKLIAGKVSRKVAIQMDHFPDGSKLQLPLLSYYSNKDTIITVNNYRPVVKPLVEVDRPAGYLIPKNLTELVAWADRHKLQYHDFRKSDGHVFEQYMIAGIDSMDFEGDITVNPYVQVKKLNTDVPGGPYIYIPVKQLKGTLIITALEPKSELGLVTYKKYEHLLKKGEYFPVIRVIK